tara:strand:+ start:9351 stop:9782 length:432 start_codon:yes stop_codon:yes gene_type:complete
MNISEYIKNKDNINIYNLVGNNEIISLYNLEEYSIFNNINNILSNPFLENELFIFIIEPNSINEKFFNKTNGLNNVILFIYNNRDFQNNKNDYKKILVSHGYKHHKIDDNNKIKVFIYDISEYKDKPDWLNSENWANPELWDK